MEWLESGLRAALHKDACGLLAALLNDPALPVPDGQPRPGEKRQRARKKEVLTLFGPVELRRDSFYPGRGRPGRRPLDEALGLVQSYSPGVARLLCRAGARHAYETASADLQAFCGLAVSGRQINRLVDLLGPPMQAALAQETVAAQTPAAPRMYISADGTGVPLRRGELLGRKGKQPDGSAKTREAKLGCVFTSHPKEGADPWRDRDSTSYLASFEPAADFGPALRKEALRRGLGRAREVVFLGDGAAWVWELARVNFPQAVEILDYYHACEHLTGLVDTLLGKDTPAGQALLERWKGTLYHESIEPILAEARRLLPPDPDQRAAAEAQLPYFERNRERLRYGALRAQGYFIGSGVVEAGCKSLIGHRLKQSGMFWSEYGAQNILTLRCALHSNRFDAYWDQRHAPPQRPEKKAA
jgi:hypothetical protein